MIHFMELKLFAIMVDDEWLSLTEACESEVPQEELDALDDVIEVRTRRPTVASSRCEP